MENPELYDATWATLAAEDRRRRDFQSTATAELSARVGQIHAQYPFLQPGVKLAAAKANLSDDQIEQIAKGAAPYSVDTRGKAEKKNKGLWGNITGALKGASRYTFAGLNFVPQVAQGAVGQLFDKNKDVDGWFISTDLGSLIKNGDQAGTGFFIGGRAAELQSERARRYRGEINGEAFTIGRGLASTFLKPDTVAYRVMSGAIDAGAAIATPSIPLAGAIGAAARAADEAGTAGTVVSGIANVSRQVGKGSKEISVTKLSAAEREALAVQAGLTGDTVDLEQANRFFKTGFGRRIIKRTAETNDFSETWNLWGRKLDPATVQKLADSKTEAEVMGTLLNVLGTEVTNTAGIAGGRRAYRSLAQRNALVASLPFGKGVSRAYAKMPHHSINLFQAETPRDQILQLDTVDRALKLFKADPLKRTEFINRAGKLLISKNEEEIGKFYDDLAAEARKAMEQNGTHKNIIDAIYKRFTDYKEQTNLFAADTAGNATDYGLFPALHGLPPDANAEIFASGTLASELGNREFFIPDPKQVRRLTNKYNWLWVKKDPNLKNLDKAGQLRLPFYAVEHFQEQIWRKYITATFGNFVRNTIDSQVSIALSGKAGAASPFTHPFQWWSFVKHNTGKGDLLGQDWETLGSSGVLDDALRDYRAATGDIVGSYYKDPIAPQRRAKKLGIFKQYERPMDTVSADVVRAHGDELGKLNADWAVRTMAQGKTVDEVVDLIKSGDKDAVRWFNTMNTSFKNGRPIWNAVDRTTRFASIDLEVPGNLKRLLETNLTRLESVTGNHPELLDIVGLGMLKGAQETVPAKFIRGNLAIGSRVEVTEVRKIGGKNIKNTYLARVEDTVTSASGAVDNVIVSPYAFDGYGDISTKLEDLLGQDRIYFDSKMPRFSVGEIRNPDTPEMARLRSSMDAVLDKFHSYLYTKPISTLERSPAFRSIYYDWVGKLAVSMDEASLNTVIARIEAAQKNPAEYLGKELWDKLKDLQANPSKLYGTLTAEEVSSFASASALDEYKKVFYNAVERRNGTDVMRLASPFAQQWSEFIGRMARFATVPVKGGELGYLPNVKNLRKMQLAWEGGTGADPDGNGRGIIFKDPTSGQWSFSFPLTGSLTKMVTGVNAPIVAPIKGIAMGLDLRPGLGPFATIAMSAITPNSPKFDMVRKLTMPYGEKSISADSFVPTYVQKIYQGVTGKSDGRYFANTYAETMQALAATGKYDLSDPNQRDAMLEDARTKAQFLSVLRGITQFTGPASGNIDVSVPTEVGDVHVSNLAKALQVLRDNNYDTANLRFIEIFGDDAFSYLGNKTVSEVGGLESSTKFGEFERNNTGLFRQYKDIAGYFGPLGTNFDFEVYTRQLQTGSRRRLTAEELLAASERAIGMAFYKDVRDHLGPTYTKEEREYLSTYRKKIEDKYPGFSEVKYNPNDTPNKINKLFEAARRDDLTDNPVASGVRYYEQIRNLAMQEANRRGYKTLDSANLGDLHEYLASYASAITEKYPEFARVYDRLLSLEIDQ